jgi:hypothetical protein
MILTHAARLALATLALLVSAAYASWQSAPEAGESAPPLQRGPFVMNRGPDRLAVRFPRDEELQYSVSIALGVLGTPTVGKVTMASKVEPFTPTDAPLLEGVQPTLEQVLVSAVAEGSYAVYSVKEVIATRVLPQLFPRLEHTTTQTGSENRRRELLIGRRDDAPISTYRSDGHCKGCKERKHFVESTWPWKDAAHCDGCKRGEHRDWREPRTKEIPEGVLDMVSAVMLARTMVEQGRSEVQFTLLDREKLWEVELKRGRRGRRKVSAGEYDVVEVLLGARAGVAASEGAKSQGEKKEEFVGLFGMHGSISIWMHPESGVPVAITGLVPAGPVTLDVVVELIRARGAPESFRTVVKPPAKR